MNAEQIQRDGRRPGPVAVAEWQTEADREHYRTHIERVPGVFRRNVRDRFMKRRESEGRIAANTYLLEAAGGIQRRLSEAKATPKLASDDAAIRKTAKKAAEAAGIQRRRAVGQGDAWDTMAALCRRHGIQPAEAGKGKDAETEAGALARMECPKWWTRRLRRARARAVEGAGILAGLVGDGKGSHRYASGFAVTRKRQQDQDNAAALEAARAICDDTDEEVKLSKIIESTLANPKLKRGELMTRVRGFDEAAQARGHVGLFLTLTCPSRFHAANDNPNYDGSTPREAQVYLREVWARIRALWAKRGMKAYGLRVAEPHRDACPHWHLLVFFPHEQAAQARRIARREALRDTPDEKGARKHRFKSERIDRSRGSAAGYVAKYIAKAIDGQGDHKDKDLLGTMTEDSIAEAAERIRAWASTWGIRQFQQLGGPPVTVWRELRRMNADPGMRPAEVEAARLEADAGRWAGFVEAMGGPTCAKRDMPVSIHRQAKPGEVDRYGDPAKPKIHGVNGGGFFCATRTKTWRIEFTPEGATAAYQPGEITEHFHGDREAAFRSAKRDPWTRGSNCNPPTLGAIEEINVNGWRIIHAGDWWYVGNRRGGRGTGSASGQIDRENRGTGGRFDDDASAVCAGTGRGDGRDYGRGGRAAARGSGGAH